jgi:Bacterial Ig domain
MSAPVHVTITATNRAPTVAVVSPQGGRGKLAGDVIVVDANPGDLDGYIRSVEFYDGAKLIGTATAAPWSVVWVGEVGAHSLTAKAFDNSDASTTSVPVNVTLKASNVAPTGSIKSPLAGSLLVAGQPVSVASNPGDVDGYIRSVRFFDGPVLIGTAVAAPWSVTWTPAAGTHTLSAVVTDNSDVAVTSRPVVVKAAAP